MMSRASADCGTNSISVRFLIILAPKKLLHILLRILEEVQREHTDSLTGRLQAFPQRA